MGLSATGTSVTFIALPYFLRDAGPYVISMVMLASLVPAALGAPAAGYAVDQYSNRRLLVYAQLAAAAAVGAMVFALHVLPLLIMLLVVMGAAAALTSPAMSALLPKITGEDGATQGYAKLATARSIGSLAGLGLGGLLAAGPGITVALLVDSASFLALAIALSTIEADRVPDKDQALTAHHESVLAGLRKLAEDRVLLVCMVGLAAGVVLAVMVNVAEVYFVTTVLHAGGLTFGVLAASWGLGMVAGARLAGRLDSTRRLTFAVFGCGVGMGVVLLAPAAVPIVAVTVVAWLIGGACNAAQNVALQGLVRSRVPDELRGRAFAGMNSSIVTANVLGTFAGGPATAVLGPRLVFATAGLGTIVTAIAALVVLRPTLRADTGPAPSRTDMIAVARTTSASGAVDPPQSAVAR